MANVLNTKKKHNHNKLMDTISGYLFISPALIAFILFIGGPVLLTVFFYDFTKYNIISPVKFDGFRNFIKIWKDPEVATVFLNTFKFVIILVPLHVVVGLLLALGVSRKIATPMKYFCRTAIYFPVVVTTASVTVVWAYLFNFDFGVVNYFLNIIGIQSIPWLKSANWSYVTVAIFSLWKFVGNSFIFYLIGLQNIPDTYLEAAEIDGANRLTSFFKIKLPLLTPTIFFVLTIQLIGCFQIFDEPYLLTQGGPGDSTKTIALQIYQQAFRSYDMGYASAFAAILFVIILGITAIQFGLQKKWVTYDYE
jgi:multiple sugar transport system permease protein